MMYTIIIMNILNRKSTNIIKNLIKITVAAVMYAAGVTLFFDPNNLVPGGATSVAMIINRISGVEIGTLVFFINVPLLLISIWKLGLRFLISTIYAILISSISMNILSMCKPLTNDLLLATIAGGGLVALSLGIIFLAGATTGKTDIVVRLIKLRHKHMKTGRIFMTVDITVVIIFILIFGNIDEGLYSALTVITSSIILDMILYGKDEAKLLYIISHSEKKEKILVEQLLNELDVGVTYLKGYGAYRHLEKRL